MVFRAFQGQMECLECRVYRDHKDPKEGKVQRDRSVIRDRTECRVQEGAKGHPGKADPEESREWKVNQDLWEWKESEALWEINEEKETKERKEKAPKQVKQV